MVEDELLKLLREIRDLLAKQLRDGVTSGGLTVKITQDQYKRLVEEQIQAVNAEPMDNTNLWGTR